jgi:methyltransferase-like protein
MGRAILRGGEKMPTVEEVMKAYVTTRDEISERTTELDKELEPLRNFQKAREEWLTAALDAAGVNSMAAKGVATAFFKKNEWVKVDDFQAFLGIHVYSQLAEGIKSLLDSDARERVTYKQIFETISQTFPSEFFVKNVTKEPILSLMGDVVIEKDETGKVIKEARPNPPPAGISYGAKRVLQVNKK